MGRKNKADVGIITFHCADNYGAMLQAYGLKKYLCDSGINTDIVRYEPPFMTGRHWWIPYIPIGNIQKQLRLARSGWKSHRRMGKDFFRLRNHMKAFRKQYLIDGKQKKKFFRRQLRGLSYRYYIVGSDQIWNPGITCGLRAVYFGAFENEKKERVIAYAASLGSAALPEEYRQQFSELLKGIHAISAREEAALSYIRQCCGKNVTAVLDPVFLLGKECWEAIEKLPDRQGYILVHMTEREPKIIDYAKKLSQDRNLPVIELRTNTGGVSEETFEIEYTAGPAEFLGYIHKADYIITNSFHMTAFSIIYEKKFLVFLHSSLGARIRNILTLHGMERRLYEEDTIPDIDGAVNWNEVKQKTVKNRKQSEKFLLENL